MSRRRCHCVVKYPNQHIQMICASASYINQQKLSTITKKCDLLSKRGYNKIELGGSTEAWDTAIETLNFTNLLLLEYLFLN